MELHEALATRVAGWRADGYPSGCFPAIAEILNFAVENPVPPDAVAAVRAFVAAG